MWEYGSIVATISDFLQGAGNPEQNFLIFEGWQLSLKKKKEKSKEKIPAWANSLSPSLSAPFPFAVKSKRTLFKS